MTVKIKELPNLEITNTSISCNSKIKIRDSKLFLLEKSDKIIYPKRSLINYFSFSNWEAKKKLGKLFELVFFGLNFNAKRIKHYRKPWVLDLQKSHKIKVAEERIGLIKTKVFKRRVLFFSYDLQKVTTLVSLLKSFRNQNSYSGHGLILKTDSYKTKPGKIRQK